MSALTRLTRLTKNELINKLLASASEIVQLRARISELEVLRQAQPPVDQCAECREREYASFVEAKNNMLRLIAWDTDKRFVFTQRGNKVVCKLRAHH